MKAVRLNVDDWLRQEAHVAAGPSFQFKDCSCVPVVPDVAKPDLDHPIGFLLTHGTDVSFVDVHTTDGEQIMTAWSKNHLQEAMEEDRTLPAECWYG